ncbi:molybdate ABC transporter substrate-binding protein [Cognatishimia sp. MH4019]|uniref:molybdate ABC transporter substrate-binding protein n=1 Tax=Cognatishimia sp. MH4019 TaxID=2854030 RepID=UPI001CD40B52|nr:molybdate ABC transporter substrate-binding protein [Cognatishimia sp. MH4019]
MRSTLFSMALLWLCASAAWAERVTVFAASSLTSVLGEIAAEFETETGHEVTLSVAGSAALARQILSGAPADIFLSANPDWMDAVKGETVPGTRRELLGNRLVLIAPAPSDPVPLTADALTARLVDGPLAMALFEAVPAGQYGKAALEHLGLWTTLAPKVAQTDNVRAALALVALGEAHLGIVYATDAQADPRVTTVATFDPESHPPIRYPVAALTDRPVTHAFLDHLTASRAIFERHGFEVLP